MAGTLELPIEETVCAIAEKHGWLVRKVSWPGRRAAPDRLFAKVSPCGETRHLFIEFKRPGKEPGLLQKKEHTTLIAAGFEVHVCDSINAALRILEL